MKENGASYPGKKAWVIFFAMIALFIVLESKGLTNMDPGDEFVYIYSAKMMAEGHAVYKDFFHAHPPLKILLMSLIFKVFGFNLAAFKIIPLLSIIISAYLIFKIMLDLFGRDEAIVSSALFLFSVNVLKYSTYILGVCMTAAFVASGIYHLYKKNYFLSGLFFGFAGITGLYSLPVIFAAMIILLLNKRYNLFRLFAGFSVVFFGVNLLFLVLYGSFFWSSVYLYHFMKTPMEGNTFSVFLSVIISNLMLFLSAALFFFCKKKRLSVVGLMAISYIAFLLLLNRLFKTYFVILAVLLAIIGGYSIVCMLRKIRNRKLQKIIIACIIALVVSNGIFSAAEINKTYFSSFSIGYSMADHIRENSAEDDTIFGDGSIAPMLALLSERRLALDIADTNEMVFSSGIKQSEDTIAKLSREKPRFMIFRPFGGIFSIKEYKFFMEKNCEVVNQYKDRYFGDFFLMGCEYGE